MIKATKPVKPNASLRLLAATVGAYFCASAVSGGLAAVWPGDDRDAVYGAGTIGLIMFPLLMLLPYLLRTDRQILLWMGPGAALGGLLFFWP